MNQLPETGFLSLPQIIGHDEVTEEQAKEKRKRKKGPKRPRRAIPAIVPVKKSAWWQGVQSGRFPKGLKLGNGHRTFWRVEEIRALIASA